VESSDGRALLERHAPGTDHFPVLVLYDGRVLIDPANDELAEATGGSTNPDARLYDVAVVGGGRPDYRRLCTPRRKGLRSIVIEVESSIPGRYRHGSWIVSRCCWKQACRAFAAGDVRHGSAKRVAAAVGEGSTAILLVRQYLDDL
jgi:hypothetical protein